MRPEAAPREQHRADDAAAEQRAFEPAADRLADRAEPAFAEQRADRRELELRGREVAGEQIGGEGSLGRFADMLKDHPQAAGVLGKLDRDGDGNPLDDIADMARGLFGKT